MHLEFVTWSLGSKVAVFLLVPSSDSSFSPLRVQEAYYGPRDIIWRSLRLFISIFIKEMLKVTLRKLNSFPNYILLTGAYIYVKGNNGRFGLIQMT